MKRFLIWIIAGLAVFSSLVFYNYVQAQKDIKNTMPAPLSIELVSFPDRVKVGESASFVWYLSSSPDLSTSYTAIYWGYQSSPSALTTSDSPEAVMYPSSELDYADGVFSLPDTFDLNLVFKKPGRVWFRVYAKVKEAHLWSGENSVIVE
jgi:hypothetical protein